MEGFGEQPREMGFKLPVTGYHSKPLRTVMEQEESAQTRKQVEVWGRRDSRPPIEGRLFRSQAKFVVRQAGSAFKTLAKPPSILVRLEMIMRSGLPGPDSVLGA